MISLRDILRGFAAVCGLAVMTAVGQYLSEEAPVALSVYRFVNGAALLFLLVVLLFKWDEVRRDLMEHRREIVKLLEDMSAAYRQDSQLRAGILDDLAQRADRVAREVAEHTEEVSRQAHAKLNQRLDELNNKLKQDPEDADRS